jgi:ABC-type lipoprotein export system ATPase subunit
MTDSGEVLIQIEGLVRSFGEGERQVRVLRGLDLAIHKGEIVALYGPSGSGKTTLLNLIGALDRPNKGVIFIEGKDITRWSERKRARLRRTQIGFIFQSYSLLPTYSALENIDLALRLPRWGYFKRHKQAQAALAAVGLTAWADHVPDELSGGQRQRVAIARALAFQPSIVLADEPTSGLDTQTTQRVMALFQGIARSQGTTFLIVSHDPIINTFVDTAYDLEGGVLRPRALNKGNGKIEYPVETGIEVEKVSS